jgi:hypothetical protein
MNDLVTQTRDTSLSGLFYAISFQIVGIIISFMASSVNYTFLLFADTAGHEFALSVPILATALFTILAFKGVFLSPFEQAFPPRACTPARRCTHVSFGMWLHSYLSAEAAVVR